MKSKDAKAPNSKCNSIKNEHFKTSDNSSLKRKATTENINVKKKEK